MAESNEKKVPEWMRPSFTNIDRSKCTRVVPMEVLVLGMSKTGTSSMKQALLDLGYSDVYHMTSFLIHNHRDSEMWVRAFDACYGNKGKFGREEWDQLLGHCMAVTDVPAISFTHELIEAYPEAKVIMLTRNIDAWYESYSSTVGKAFIRHYNWYCRPWSFQKLIIGKNPVNDVFSRYFTYCGEQWSPACAKKWYIDQIARVRYLVPKEKLLEFNVTEGWGPLCEFLDKPIPKDKPFPRIMERSEFANVSRGTIIYETITMAIHMAKVFGVMSVLGVVLWFGRSKIDWSKVKLNYGMK